MTLAAAGRGPSSSQTRRAAELDSGRRKVLRTAGRGDPVRLREPGQKSPSLCVSCFDPSKPDGVPPRGPAQSTLPASRQGGGGRRVARMSLSGPGLHSCFWEQTLQDPDSEAGVPPHSLRGRTKLRVWDRRYQVRDPCGHERGGSARAELTPLPRASTPPACPPTGPGTPVKGCSPAPRVRPQSAPRRSFRFRGK